MYWGRNEWRVNAISAVGLAFPKLSPCCPHENSRKLFHLWAVPGAVFSSHAGLRQLVLRQHVRGRLHFQGPGKFPLTPAVGPGPHLLTPARPTGPSSCPTLVLCTLWFNAATFPRNSRTLIGNHSQADRWQSWHQPQGRRRGASQGGGFRGLLPGKTCGHVPRAIKDRYILCSPPRDGWWGLWHEQFIASWSNKFKVWNFSRVSTLSLRCRGPHGKMGDAVGWLLRGSAFLQQASCLSSPCSLQDSSRPRRHLLFRFASRSVCLFPCRQKCMSRAGCSTPVQRPELLCHPSFPRRPRAFWNSFLSWVSCQSIPLNLRAAHF